MVCYVDLPAGWLLVPDLLLAADVACLSDALQALPHTVPMRVLVQLLVDDPDHASFRERLRTMLNKMSDAAGIQ
jgi:hypothetical protein